MNAILMHRLLKRQIKKHNIPANCLEEYPTFFAAINEAYKSNDLDLGYLENILEKSSQELYKANVLLKQDNLTKTREALQAKRQLDRVLSNVTDAIYELDAEGRFVFLNKAWETYSEESIVDCLGRSHYEFEDRIETYDKELFRQSKEGQLTEFKTVYSRYTKEGKLKWWELSNKFVYDKDGTRVGAIGSISDVTGMKEKEDQLRQLSEVKSNFLSTMSHEIRTPLNAIVAISNILLMDDPNAKDLENFNALKFSSGHLLSLINDILDYNKLESGHLEFNDEPFNLYFVIDGIINSFKFIAQEKNITLEHDIMPCIPNIISGDSTKLSQVLSNLISNGIKFTSKGGVKMKVSCKERRDQTVKLEFQIIDTGIGIKEEKIEKIFHRFNQADNMISIKYGGTGLGLAISKKIVELQSGTIEVESEFGKGSTFTVCMDYGIVNDPKTINFRSATNKVGDLSGMKVLVVDDNEMNLLVAGQMLKKWGVITANAHNGQEAVEMVLAQDFDAVLMDIRMPIMDGYEATRKIRGLVGSNSELPIIALTASVSNDIGKKVKENGMDAYLTKPFNPMDLLAKLSHVRQKVLDRY